MSPLRLKRFGKAERILLMIILLAGSVFSFSFLRQGLAIFEKSVRADNWIQHGAMVLEFDSISIAARQVDRSRIKIKYAYRLDGIDYIGKVFSHSQPLTSWTKGEVNLLRKEYKPGNTIKIYVNPSAHEESVVERHVRPAVWRAMVFGIIFLLAPFVAFLVILRGLR